MAQNQGILSVEGFTGVAGGLLFLRFGIGLRIWRLGNYGYNLAKPRTFAKKYGFAKLYRVLRDSMNFVEWNEFDVFNYYN